MTAYHRTFHSKAILRDGFKDATGSYLTDRKWTGVWISDKPLDINEGADGDVLLSIEISSKTFTKYEWIEEGKPYREALLPAKILNTLRVSIVEENP